MTEIEQRFDRYFATLDEDDPLRFAHILDLNAAQSSDVRDLATAFADIKAEINNRFETDAVGIVAPEGACTNPHGLHRILNGQCLRVLLRRLVFHRCHRRNA
jgi:hypothetical protein